MPTPGLQKRPLNSPAETATFILCVVSRTVFRILHRGGARPCQVSFLCGDLAGVKS